MNRKNHILLVLLCILMATSLKESADFIESILGSLVMIVVIWLIVTGIQSLFKKNNQYDEDYTLFPVTKKTKIITLLFILSCPLLLYHGYKKEGIELNFSNSIEIIAMNFVGYGFIWVVIASYQGIALFFKKNDSNHDNATSINNRESYQPRVTPDDAIAINRNESHLPRLNPDNANDQKKCFFRHNYEVLPKNNRCEVIKVCTKCGHTSRPKIVHNMSGTLKNSKCQLYKQCLDCGEIEYLNYDHDYQRYARHEEDCETLYRCTDCGDIKVETVHTPGRPTKIDSCHSVVNCKYCGKHLETKEKHEYHNYTTGQYKGQRRCKYCKSR